MRKQERAEEDLALVCWDLALPWPVRERRKRALGDLRRWGVGRRARREQSAE
ncbi:hypothetical protein TNMX_01155 [Thermus sp. NMX2.A1]|nr:hypothetical protein TNMX_01155 [Thermus sp. NMX2.A1]